MAAGAPIACGAAFRFKVGQTGQVAASFFGDGANNEGAFHEALNIASVWVLPVVFVCENNQYGMSTSTERSTAVKNVADRASAYAMPGVIVDGNNFADVAEASFAAVQRARAGQGPTLIEAKTYRTRGHSRSDRNRYRTKDEISSWEQKDPIAAFESEIVALGLASTQDIAKLREEVERIVQESVRLQGGRIEVQNLDDHGTRFSIGLPLSHPVASS